MLERYFEIMQISYFQLLSLLFSHSVVSNHLQPHKWQRARLPCPSLFPGVCSILCSLSQWCHLTISFSVSPFSSCAQSFSASGTFPTSRLFLCPRWPKYWSFSFSFSPSHEYSELIQLKLSQFCPLTVVLVCISLMISDVEHLFMYLLAIWMTSLGKYLSKCYLDLFFNWIILFLLLSCMSSLYIFL